MNDVVACSGDEFASRRLLLKQAVKSDNLSRRLRCVSTRITYSWRGTNDPRCGSSYCGCGLIVGQHWLLKVLEHNPLLRLLLLWRQARWRLGNRATGGSGEYFGCSLRHSLEHNLLIRRNRRVAYK